MQDAYSFCEKFLVPEVSSFSELRATLYSDATHKVQAIGFRITTSRAKVEWVDEKRRNSYHIPHLVRKKWTLHCCL